MCGPSHQGRGRAPDVTSDPIRGGRSGRPPRAPADAGARAAVACPPAGWRDRTMEMSAPANSPAPGANPNALPPAVPVARGGPAEPIRGAVMTGNPTKRAVRDAVAALA